MRIMFIATVPEKSRTAANAIALTAKPCVRPALVWGLLKLKRMIDMNPKLEARRIFDNYYHDHGGKIQGLCAVIANDIIDMIGGEPVAGYLTTATGLRRLHWWVDFNGMIIDPMRDQYSTEPGFYREEIHRGNKELLKKEYHRQLNL